MSGRELLSEFAGRVHDTGLLETGGWSSLPLEYYEEEEGPEWEPDWDERV
jgi:hypothetical protein